MTTIQTATSSTTKPAGDGSLARLRSAALSLQTKATALIVLVILAVTTAVTAYSIHYSSRFVREQQEAQLVQAASLLAKAAAPMMMDNMIDGVAELARRAANGAPLLYVMLTDVDGRELASAVYGPAGVQRPTPALGKPGGALEHALSESVGAQGRGVLSISYPISQRQPATEGNDDGRTRLLGYVYTGMSANEWQRSLAAHMDFVIGVGAIALIVVVPLGFWLVHRIMAPVDSLAETMIKFSHGGLNVRSKVKGGDEIGRLAQAFNRMADQHRQTHERLVRLNLELERRVAERTWQLRELASREPLTGLYNRRHFNEVLRRRFAEAIRHGSELSCIMIDLDGFKHANDAFGHQVGDELLVLTATMILSQLRVSDVAARYGGDEFILLLPQTDAEQAHVLGQRIMQQFDREALTRFPQAKVSMSMGVSSVNSSGVSEADELVKSADQAMYAAKQAGKGRVVMASRAAQGAGV